MSVTADPVATGAGARRRPRLLLISPDVIGHQMAGTGMRFVSIAQQLSTVADVTLAVGVAGSDISAVEGRGFSVIDYETRAQLTEMVERSDVAFCQLVDLEVVRKGMKSGCRFIFDLYNVLPAESIGSERIGGFDTQPQLDRSFGGLLGYFRHCLRAGAYFVTSNERQRDYWIGYLMASDAMLPSTLDDRSPEDIIGLLPFGMEDAEPIRRNHGIRGRFGIADEDFVVLWAGGIWDWFDAETPIRAVAKLREDGHQVRLVFYGTTHPNSSIGVPKTVLRAQTLGAELGVLDNGVHFIEGWVPASERADYLLDADAGICAHKRSFETRYSFRTRILDHFWAELPSVVTEGDWFADYIDANHLGTVVAYGDVVGTEAAILELMDDARRAPIIENVRAIKDDWRWAATSHELVEVVADWENRLLSHHVPTDLTAPWYIRLRWRLSHTFLGTFYRAVVGR